MFKKYTNKTLMEKLKPEKIQLNKSSAKNTNIQKDKYNYQRKQGHSTKVVTYTNSQYRFSLHIMYIVPYIMDDAIVTFLSGRIFLHRFFFVLIEQA